MLPQYQPRSLSHPSDDPLPWLTEMWPPEVATSLPVTSQEQVNAALSAAQRALDSFVAGLSDAETSFRVVLGKAEAAPAGTMYDEHVVFVGTKPWSHYAKGELTFGQLVAVFVGLAYHEVGHIRHDRDDSTPMKDWLRATYKSDAVYSIARSCDNICRDLRLEARQQQDFPGFVEALRLAMWWVSTRSTGPSNNGPLETSTVGGRHRAFVSGARYPWEEDWTGFESLRDSWGDWAARSEAAPDMAAIQSLVTEAVEAILAGADPEGPVAPPPTGPEGPVCGPVGPSDPDDEGGEQKTTTKGGGTEEPGDDESTESDDSDGEGEEPQDDDPDDDTEGEGEGDDGDEPDEPVTEGDDEPEDDGPDTEGEGPTLGSETQPGPESEPQDGEPEDEGDDSDDTAEGGEEPGDDDDEPDPDEPAELTDGEMKVEQGTADDSETGWDPDDVNIIQRSEPRGCIGQPALDPDDAVRAAGIAHHAASTKQNKRRTFTYSDGVRENRRTIVETRLDKHAVDVYPSTFGASHNFETLLPAATRSSSSSGYRPFRRSKSDPNASRALAAVMASNRKGPGAPEFAQRQGRIDRRRLGRLTYGESRVFLKPDAAAPQKVLAGILIDASGSMQWGEDPFGGSHKPNIEKAAQVGRNLADAIESLPWARGFVAAHTTAYSGSGSGPVYIPIWTSGEPTEYLDDVLTIAHNGNEDGFAVAYACEEILDSLKRDEKGLLVVISDGAPAYSNGESHTREVVDTYRKRGIRIVSVSLSGSLTVEVQERMYGATDVVPYSSNTSVFAQSVARVIGSSI